MRYLLSFLEGIVTFISPCLLPLLPVYVSYFAADGAGNDRRRALKNALGFVAGFTLVFLALGLFAGALGGFLSRYAAVLNIALGAVVVLFGLSFMGVLRLPSGGGRTVDLSKTGFFRSLLFGAVFSVSWTPCVGAFLGSALALASASGSAATGALMLLCYSAGLGVPFVLSAVLLEELRGAFDAIKKHYKLINLICGGLLVVTGVLMMTGLLQRLLGAVSA